jgi:hypothetical protein
MNQTVINAMVNAAKGKLREAGKILDAMTTDAPSDGVHDEPAPEGGTDRLSFCTVPKTDPEVKPFIPPTPEKRAVEIFHTFQDIGTISENGVEIPECGYFGWPRMLKPTAVQGEIDALDDDVPLMCNWDEGGARLPLDEKQLEEHRWRFYSSIPINQQWRAGYYNLASTTLTHNLPNCGVGFVRATYNSSADRDPYKIAPQCNYLDRQMESAVANGWETIIPSFNPFIHKGRKDGIIAPMDLQIEAMAHLLIMWERIDTIIWWGGSDTADHADYITEVVLQAFEWAGVAVA